LIPKKEAHVARAPFQVLVIPYRKTDERILYAAFRRSDGDYWQWIAGGGEDDETPVEAARREAFEEAGIARHLDLLRLDSNGTVPVMGICGYLRWGPDILVVPEHIFAVELSDRNITLSEEHTEFRWVDYDTAVALLKWDSNKNALWELNYRLMGNL
jgi:dATP pyrophosphohydrolase